MINKNRVISGCQRYVDEQIVNKMAGWQRWIFGAGAGVMLSKADRVIDTLKQNPVISAMGIINGEEIDVEIIYKEMKRQAQNAGSINVNIPYIGNLTLCETDIDSLYQYIVG